MAATSRRNSPSRQASNQKRRNYTILTIPQKDRHEERREKTNRMRKKEEKNTTLL